METPALLPGMTPNTTALFVHAHPDDETIVTGGTMAAAAAQGVNVVLVTCTRGELGEVIPAELAHLEVKPAFLSEDMYDAGHPLRDAPLPGAGLASVREQELAAALAALGVSEHIWLGQGLTAPAGGEVTFRDSGMAWGQDGRATASTTVLPGSLSRAPFEETAELLAAAIRALRPQSVISYAADGGYGHPDHVRAHQLTMAALRIAAVPVSSPAVGAGASAAAGTAPGTLGWVVPHVYAIVSDRPERPHEDGVVRLAVAGNLCAKTAAMKAHRTQITVDRQRYALSDNVWKDIAAVEEFVAVDPALIYGQEKA